MSRTQGIPMINLRTFNKKLAKLGNIELVKGEGYFYFAGDDVVGPTGVLGDTLSVYTYRFSHLTEERWMAEAKDALDKSRIW